MLPSDSMPELADARARVSALERQRVEDVARNTAQFTEIKEHLADILIEVRKTNGRVTTLENHERLSAVIWTGVKAFGLVVAGGVTTLIVQVLLTRWGLQ